MAALRLFSSTHRYHMRLAQPYNCRNARQCIIITSMDAKYSQIETGAVRRALLYGAVGTLIAPASHAANPAVQRGLSVYVKKKKLDRIETYVAPLIEARGQLIRVGRVMLQDAAAARELLRTGIFSGIRDDVRAVGEYSANREGNSKAVGIALNSGFFQPLEKLDSLLGRSVREKIPLDVDEAKRELEKTVAGLDALLSSIPPELLERAQAVADSFKVEEGENVLENEQLKDLEQLVAPL